MSHQRGNASRSRPQKYKNQTSFKNNLHDNSKKTKLINNIEITDVCERCKKIIEWKIKYKKYKMLKAPMKCIKCELKTVKHSYHNICLPCAQQQKVCSKCGQKREIVGKKAIKEEQIKLDTEFRVILKMIPERKRRTFLRYMDQQINTDIDKTSSKDETDEINLKKRDLLIKLKSLAITEDDDNIDSDTDNERENDAFE
ncbi:uncharacterized protein C9orf85 homolog isoform X2 [Monomorium pharaonis]|uniref:uncharacterized protein C9orf85 homolog isoform X2 n=1 Tax=Monomorium pharaonis TaxID=307658 RepID=UPI00063F89CF|nr:uncharacterized protein C9orf85 homolog isoform X2 [Monomorium pharaonis]